MLPLLPAIVCLATAWASPSDRVRMGGLGHVDHGFLLGDVTGLGEELGASAPPAGLVLGGGGALLLGGGVVLRGEGHLLYGLRGIDLGGDVAASGGGGSLGVGGALLNDGAHLMYPYVGVAMHGMDVFASNASATWNIGGDSLALGERRHYQGSGLAIDVGASIFRLHWREGGGMAFGGTLGLWLPVGPAEWATHTGQALKGLNGGPGGMYLRMHVGGGGGTT